MCSQHLKSNLVFSIFSFSSCSSAAPSRTALRVGSCRKSFCWTCQWTMATLRSRTSWRNCRVPSSCCTAPKRKPAPYLRWLTLWASLATASPGLFPRWWLEMRIMFPQSSLQVKTGSMNVFANKVKAFIQLCCLQMAKKTAEEAAFYEGWCKMVQSFETRNVELMFFFFKRCCFQKCKLFNHHHCSPFPVHQLLL